MPRVTNHVRMMSTVNEEDSAAAMAAPAPSMLAKFKESRAPALTLYLFLWYLFNAGFNVTNKLVLNKFPHPWVVSWFQLATGLLFVVPAWTSGFRSPPLVDKKCVVRKRRDVRLEGGGFLRL